MRYNSEWKVVSVKKIKLQIILKNKKTPIGEITFHNAFIVLVVGEVMTNIPFLCVLHETPEN